MTEPWDESDLAALRRLKRPKQPGYAERLEAEEAQARAALDGRRLRAAPGDGAPRTRQFNVRVRDEIKEMAHEIVRHERSTLTEVVETAIERLHETTFKQPRP